MNRTLNGRKTFLGILKALIGGFQNRGVGLREFGGDPGNVRNGVKLGEQTKLTMANPMDLVKQKVGVAKTWHRVSCVDMIPNIRGVVSCVQVTVSWGLGQQRQSL